MAMAETQVPVRSKRWLWIAVIWLAAGLVDASQNVLLMRAEGRHHSWLPLFGTELATWMPWALATPFISYLARQHSLTRGFAWRTAAIHVATFTTVALIAVSWSSLLQVLFNPWGNKKWPTYADEWVELLLYQTVTFVIVYALITTVTLVLD